MTEKQRFHVSAATLTLEKYLRDQEPGTKFTFDQLSEIAGKDIRVFRYIIPSVNARLIKHHDKVLQSVHGEGYSLLRSDEVADYSRMLRASAKKKVIRAFNVCQTVDISTLSDKDRDKFIKEQCVSGTTLAVMRAVDSRKVIGKTPDKIAQISEGQVMALLIGGKVKTEKEDS